MKTLNDYNMEIATAKTLDRLDRIAEDASNNNSLTNEEYTAIYDRCLYIAKIWQNI